MIHAYPYAIFVNEFNKNSVLYFENFEEASKKWEEIRSKKYALETDGGKNVVVSGGPNVSWLSLIYSRIIYQKSW